MCFCVVNMSLRLQRETSGMGYICVWSLSSQESRKLSCLLRMGAAATNIFHSRRMILA